MRKYYKDLLIDGQPVLVPDADITISYEDLDSSESGRDESGFMHRVVQRTDVCKIPIAYASITRDDYLYMESLLRGKKDFQVDCRDFDGSLLSFRAYRSKHSITIFNARTGEYKNYTFNIIQC